MLELEDARARIFDAVKPLPAEDVPLEAAAGRILAEPVVAARHLPPFDNSAMDGYAVRSADVRGARPDAPVPLRLLTQVAAGQTAPDAVEPGTCVRVFTGSALPVGADAVVMQEDTRVPGGSPEEVLCSASVRPGEHIRFRGEDVQPGAALFSSGDCLGPASLGLLAALGLEQVRVSARPCVGLLATGSELLVPGEPWSDGKIYESNRVCLAALLPAAGAQPRVYPLVPDELPATCAALAAAFAECDAVITTGGVSVGELDWVKRAFRELGGELEFWKVAIRPGKPFVFGRWREKCLFGLPGNPVSALVTFLLLVRPALLKLQGANRVDPPSHPGRLAEPLANPGDRRHFIRVLVDEEGQVRSAGEQGSHRLRSLATANGLVDVPPRTTLPSGTTVRVLWWS